ncbi:tubulin binding cofactor c, putative [Plasmodium ovale]|uniref:Tubulin binding cofactor c, putative n=1 Tax=Plasmodium ovale TaxID=36330 RepID=A0A1D3TGU0_PLAOA|nr:tubulin binding cofactor c, putative [Plasmodium ovale]
MDDLTKNECANYDEIVHKNLKDIENKIKQLKNVQYNDSALKEINELTDQTIKLKEKLSNVYFQFLKHSSVIINEKVKTVVMLYCSSKLKELLKEIESLKYVFIKNQNKIECVQLDSNCDDNFLLPENEYEDEEHESVELDDMQIGISQHKLSFQNLQNERIIKGLGETECSNLLLDNLVNCEVIVLDVLSSVLIRKISNCTIWVAAVESSLLVYGCADCNILTNSKQIRIHDARNTKFYINSISSPIIESSEKLFFFQYNLNFDGLSELLKKINMDKNSSKWVEIFDFSWQNTQEKSPNFSISKETQVYDIKVEKRSTTEHNLEEATKNTYIIRNFPHFLKKIK